MFGELHIEMLYVYLYIIYPKKEYVCKFIVENWNFVWWVMEFWLRNN